MKEFTIEVYSDDLICLREDSDTYDEINGSHGEFRIETSAGTILVSVEFNRGWQFTLSASDDRMTVSNITED